MQIESSAPARTWSPYQRAVFDAVEHGTGNIVVEALAGSGKTTTILEAVARIPHGQRVLLCAFNTRIKDELQKRAPAGVEVVTLHSLGYRAVRNAWGRHVRPDDKRERKLLDEVAPWSRGEGRSAILKIVGLAKNTLAEGHAELEALAYQSGVATSVDEEALGAMIDAADEVLRRSARQAVEISFDDMVWIPAIYGWTTGAFDVVLVDETQDLCAAQIKLMRAAVRPGGRIIAVGDRHQAIYGFRGADEQAIPRLIEELKAATLPLSICYRCPRLVIEQAKQVVPAIESAVGALDGEVVTVTKDAAEKAEPGDVILSRTNAPLVPLCLSFLKRGVPAAVAGRDVAKRVRKLIDQAAEAAGSDGQIEPVIDWITAWADQQVARLLKRDLEEKADEVRDVQETVIALLDDCADLDAARARIDRVFSEAADASARVLLSTVHKAKGLEWPTVWVLLDTFKRGRRVEESNLWYVALTRCQWRLNVVSAGHEPPAPPAAPAAPDAPTAGPGAPGAVPSEPARKGRRKRAPVAQAAPPAAHAEDCAACAGVHVPVVGACPVMQRLMGPPAQPAVAVADPPATRARDRLPGGRRADRSDGQR